jgi:hypothetical protein
MLVLPPPARDLIAPLGLAFTDGLGGPVVLYGLSVSAWPVGSETAQVVASINGAGVAGFLRLPGVTIDPTAPFGGATRPFVVEVSDLMDRFQTGRVQVPAPAKGITSVALYSTSTREIAPNRLTVRAELWDAVNNRPAAFAVLTVKLASNGGTVVATGLADGAGRVLAIGDWPAPSAASPTNGTGLWNDPRPITVGVQYDPTAQVSVPRLDLLAGLPAGSLWDTRGPDAPFAPPNLTADGDAVFRSSGDARGRLLVTSP